MEQPQPTEPDKKGEEESQKPQGSEKPEETEEEKERQAKEQAEQLEEQAEKEEQMSEKERARRTKKRGEVLNQKEKIVYDHQMEGFWKWISQIQEKEGEIKADDLADQFILWWTEEQPRLENRYRQWLHKLQEERGETVKGWFNQILRLGKGPEAYAWERIYGALLDERVKEITGANLNARDRIKKFREVAKSGDLFEAQALLISLADTSDFTEEWMEEYYQTFAPEEVVRRDDPNLATKEWQKQWRKEYEQWGADVQRALKEGKDLPMKSELLQQGTLIHLGGMQDFWFETKVRRVAHVAGKRPDVWHAGRRELLRNDAGEITGLRLKTRDEWAKETESDAMEYAGRKGALAPEKDMYARYGSQDEAYAATLILKEKLAQMPQLIEEHRVKAVNIRNGAMSAMQEAQLIRMGLPKLKEEERTVAESRAQILTNRAKSLLAEAKNIEQRVIPQEEIRQKLLGKKLQTGFQYQNDEVKSILLDPDGDLEVEVAGKKYKEKELALQMGIRKYYALRAESDADVIGRAEHIRATEHVNYLNLMSERRADEFSWMTSHWLYGSRKADGSYDRTRDAHWNIIDYMKSEATYAPRLTADLAAFEGKIFEEEPEEERELDQPAKALAEHLKKTNLEKAYDHLRSNPPVDLDKLLEKSSEKIATFRLTVAEGVVKSYLVKDFPRDLAEKITPQIQEKINQLAEGQLLDVNSIQNELDQEFFFTVDQQEKVKDILEDINENLESIWQAKENAKKLKIEMAPYLDFAQLKQKQREIEGLDREEIIKYLNDLTLATAQIREELKGLVPEALEENQKERIYSLLPEEIDRTKITTASDAHRELLKLEVAFKIQWRLAGGEIKKEEKEAKKKAA